MTEELRFNENETTSGPLLQWPVPHAVNFATEWTCYFNDAKRTDLMDVIDKFVVINQLSAYNERHSIEMSLWCLI